MTETKNPYVMNNYETPNTYHEVLKLNKSDPNYDKKVKINKLFIKYKKPEQSYQEFGDWISEPAIEFGFERISRQNTNDWLRAKRLPSNKYFLATRLALMYKKARGDDVSKFDGLLEFCEEVIAILGE